MSRWKLHTMLNLAASLPASARTNDIPYEFPPYTSHPVPFNISVDPVFIDETVLKASLYRPSIDLLDDSNVEWTDGPPRSNMTALASYWAEDYDWFQTEHQININFSHFVVTVQGSGDYDHPVPLYFVHERSSNENAIPLLLIHGWPSSHLEWSKVIKPLVAPEDPNTQSYHVIAPDLPGYGFSPAPTHSGLGAAELAVVFGKLMNNLGYPRYGIIGTDLGWWVTMWMGKVVPDSVIGHFSDFFYIGPNATDLERYAMNQTSPEENLYIESLQEWATVHTDFSEVHRLWPLAIGQAMTDSSVGWAGWVWHIMFKVSDGWAYTFEEVITSAMMLWIQGTWGNMRLYEELWTVRPTSSNSPPRSLTHMNVVASSAL